MKTYEGLFILDAAGKEEVSKELVDKIQKNIEHAGGRVDKVQRMGARQFARETKKRKFSVVQKWHRLFTLRITKGSLWGVVGGGRHCDSENPQAEACATQAPPKSVPCEPESRPAPGEALLSSGHTPASPKESPSRRHIQEANGYRTSPATRNE